MHIRGGEENNLHGLGSGDKKAHKSDSSEENVIPRDHILASSKSSNYTKYQKVHRPRFLNNEITMKHRGFLVYQTNTPVSTSHHRGEELESINETPLQVVIAFNSSPFGEALRESMNVDKLGRISLNQIPSLTKRLIKSLVEIEPYRAAPSREKGKSINLIDVVVTLGYLKVEEQQLRPRITRWEPGAILPSSISTIVSFWEVHQQDLGVTCCC
ncbi:hypothetical protein Tco_0575245 [Tanacetum coccineum]